MLEHKCAVVWAPTANPRPGLQCASFDRTSACTGTWTRERARVHQCRFGVALSVRVMIYVPLNNPTPRYIVRTAHRAF